MCAPTQGFWSIKIVEQAGLYQDKCFGRPRERQCPLTDAELRILHESEREKEMIISFGLQESQACIALVLFLTLLAIRD